MSDVCRVDGCVLLLFRYSIAAQKAGEESATVEMDKLIGHA